MNPALVTVVEEVAAVVVFVAVALGAVVVKINVNCAGYCPTTDHVGHPLAVHRVMVVIVLTANIEYSLS